MNVPQLPPARMAIRVTGAGKDLGRAVSFPHSDASSYVTGATLADDGGWQAS